jgi:hypothetical protein
VAWAPVTVAGTAHWLCVEHAPGGGNTELCTIPVKQPLTIPHNLIPQRIHPSNPQKSPPPKKKSEVRNYYKPTTYTYSAIYLLNVHNTAPSYFCSYGNVMYIGSRTSAMEMLRVGNGRVKNYLKCSITATLFARPLRGPLKGHFDGSLLW